MRAWPGQSLTLSTDLIVKYIANSAAKNISSEDSQTMVPTLTRFGLLAGVGGSSPRLLSPRGHYYDTL